MKKNRRGNPDHIRKRNQPAPENKANRCPPGKIIESPCVCSNELLPTLRATQSRMLGLPLMVAAVLTLLWRQVSISE